VVPFGTVASESAVGQRIGLVASTGSDPFSKAVADSVAAQVHASGAQLISCDPGANTSLVLDCAHRLATQQVDGWITVQLGDAGEALCAAGPQDVPLITIAAAPVSCETAHVGADDERAGFLAGLALGRSSRTGDACANGALVIATNNATSAVSNHRADGIRAGIRDQCPGLLTHEVLLDADRQDQAYEGFTDSLMAVPDGTEILLAAVDDQVALGAAAAIPQARADHITMAAIGAEEPARCEITANPRWIGDAALFPDRYGEVAVPALFDALQGQEIPRNMYIETTFVTADSLGDYYDITDCPVR
jgi:ribose transport system substrate-binding protein